MYARIERTIECSYARMQECATRIAGAKTHARTRVSSPASVHAQIHMALTCANACKHASTGAWITVIISTRMLARCLHQAAGPRHPAQLAGNNARGYPAA